ncbi:MAG: hypothetical protein U9N59_10445 [Campylobacterota bacterium]|nr:hypothetical protein [Campylobacterota bacterium]
MSNYNTQLMNHDNYLSTTMLGKKLGIVQKEIIDYFIEEGLMYRSLNKLKLTDYGQKLGGLYRTRDSGKWIVWPKDLVKNKILKRFQANTKLLKSEYQDTIYHYGEYHPYHGGSNPSFNRFSGRILDLKENRNGAVDYFFQLLKDVDFDETEAIVIVPSHAPSKSSNAIKELASKLAKEHNWIDATDCVVRTHKIKKLANGGKRDKQVHLDSIKIKNKSLIERKNVLVFDDVTTSGNSLYAVMEILKKSNARSTWSYAVASTI